MEVRAAAYKSGKYYFGTGGSIIKNKSKHMCMGAGGRARRDLLSSSSGTSFPRRMLEAFQKAPCAAQSDHRPTPIQDDILPPNPEFAEDQGALCASSRGDIDSEVCPPHLEREREDTEQCCSRHVRGVSNENSAPSLAPRLPPLRITHRHALACMHGWHPVRHILRCLCV